MKTDFLIIAWVDFEFEPAFYFVINFTTQHIFDYQYLGYHRQTLVFTFLGSRSVYKFYTTYTPTW